MRPCPHPRPAPGRRANSAQHAPPPARRLVGLVVVACVVAPAVRASDPSQPPSEGFSASVEGLPTAALDAWRATVLIEGLAVVDKPDRGRWLRTNRGAGLVLGVTGDGRTAAIVTNAHVVDCAGSPCHLGVGFSTSTDDDAEVWTTLVELKSRDPRRDLAVLEVAIPEGAVVTVPELADPSCIDARERRVLTVGWPDLTTRDRWGVVPPPNLGDHVKRYSHGLYLVSYDSYRLVSQAKGTMDRMQVVLHNADVLPGSSGGPLISLGGEVLGINTHVVGGTSSAHREYCARQDVHDRVAGCVHLAISSPELARELERVESLRLPVTDCVAAPPLENDLQRTASRR